ncbi:hypothetical protein OROGR_025179 [Orobanche gracilis]
MATEDMLIMTEKAPQPILPPPDYTADEIDAVECLLMLSLSGGGTCLRPSSSSDPTMPGTPETVQDSYTTSGGEKFPPMRNVSATALSSHQLAIGGQKTQHRPNSTTAAATVSRSNHTSNSDGEGRECSICHDRFPSGQALSGHKRKHYEDMMRAVIYSKSCKASWNGYQTITA